MAYFSTTDYSFKPSSISDTLFFPEVEITNRLNEINNNNVNTNRHLGSQDLVVEGSPHFMPGGKQNASLLLSNPVFSESSSGTTSASMPYPILGEIHDSWIGKRKRGKQKVGGDHKAVKEVVHVRAKRGQATDSHSLAERVRRGKVNEKLRCLQGIVPGCYKTMGMTLMLDEIINYVRSLLNQVEFLSMKLAAASTYYDFNSESDAVEAMQRAQAFAKQSNQVERGPPQLSCSSPTWNSR